MAKMKLLTRGRFARPLLWNEGDGSISVDPAAKAEFNRLNAGKLGMLEFVNKAVVDKGLSSEAATYFSVAVLGVKFSSSVDLRVDASATEIARYRRELAAAGVPLGVFS